MWEIEDQKPLTHQLHPYVSIWLGCRRFGNREHGQPCLPEAGAYLDQDAELMLAFEVLDEILAQIEKIRKLKEHALSSMSQQQQVTMLS